MAGRVNVGQMALSLKGLAQRFAFGLLVLTAFAVMVIGKADTIIIERVRSAVVDIAAPVFDHVGELAVVVGLGFPTERVTERDVQRLGPVVARAAAEASELLGYDPALGRLATTPP